MADSFYLMYFLVFGVAFLYSSVGHGGASGYIAVMALFGLAPLEIRTNALLLNIAVASIAYLQFVRNTSTDWNLAKPLFIFSIPFAFIGGSITLTESIFKYLLALILVLPVLRFSGLWRSEQQNFLAPKTWILYLSGASIGLLSGMLGIGGGIILTPLLLWFGWTSTKQAALISALFIVVNSIAGFIGLWNKNLTLPDSFFPLLITAVIGGILGSFNGSTKFSNDVLKKLLACVLCIAIYKLITI
ncbi:MAG: sulfite exporter TauE/SafE family protein [Saprospiraceae bacterium]|nr:sulfite exporter TauE/SafE family protein [Saprospiraceae bacterium]MBK8818665.1 sulfite exporter TauE/SafE family protein [Saprospiraceae bacterium]